MRVICRSGYSGCDHPDAFFWQGKMLSVQHIIKEWREPETKHFLVTAENKSTYELILSESSGSWNILEGLSVSNP